MENANAALITLKMDRSSALKNPDPQELGAAVSQGAAELRSSKKTKKTKRTKRTADFYQRFCCCGSQSLVGGVIVAWCAVA